VGAALRRESHLPSDGDGTSFLRACSEGAGASTEEKSLASFCLDDSGCSNAAKMSSSTLRAAGKKRVPRVLGIFRGAGLVTWSKAQVGSEPRAECDVFF